MAVFGDVYGQALDRDGKPSSISARSLESDPLDLEPRCDFSILVAPGPPFNASKRSRADGPDLCLQQTFEEKGYQYVTQGKSCCSEKQHAAESARNGHGWTVSIRSEQVLWAIRSKRSELKKSCPVEPPPFVFR